MRRLLSITLISCVFLVPAQVRKIKQNKSQINNRKITNYSNEAYNKYLGYEDVNVTTGDLGCTNVIQKYDNSIDTNLLVKNNGDLDLVVKLIDINTDVAIRMVYINKGSSYNIQNIPQGRYYIKEAHGRQWKQRKLVDQCIGEFSENANYRRSKNIVDFNIKRHVDGNREVISMPSYTLELGMRIVFGRKSDNSKYNTNNISSVEFNK
ncbi:hypothetical protein M2T28_14475 [Elizabethkingia miricola]|uniref:hypothetical protein n=1 Tax=Elizabethkingia miricola TaxID=172045 RepID=UPI002018A1B7|nr:hypothetical protein [Elizabethkingia miricola]MCL1653825.1 hypothetical protein [Elizabethkingia miricola]